MPVSADVTLYVARDYATHPMGREAHLWPFSGERFRTQLLIPALGQGGMVTVDLRGTKGLAPSFLEEAFGGLIDAGFDYSDLRARLVLLTDDAARSRQIWRFIQQAAGIPLEG